MLSLHQALINLCYEPDRWTFHIPKVFSLIARRYNLVAVRHEMKCWLVSAFSYRSPLQGFFHLFSASSDLAEDTAIIYGRGFGYGLSHQPLVEEVYNPRDCMMLISGHRGAP